MNFALNLRPPFMDIINATVDILNKQYSVRCPEASLPDLQKAAALLNEKMTEVLSSGKVMQPERVAVISALNIAYQFFDAKRQQETLVNLIQERVGQLQDKVQAALNKTAETGFTYLPEEAEAMALTT